jgi:hypothetical protein
VIDLFEFPVFGFGVIAGAFFIVLRSLWPAQQNRIGTTRGFANPRNGFTS